MFAANFFFLEAGKSLPKTIDNLLESRRAEPRAKLPLATLAELWREGGMQSLGHRSTSLFFFSSRKFSFLPKMLAGVHLLCDGRERVTCRMCCAFLGDKPRCKVETTPELDTGPRALEQQKKVEGFLHCRPPSAAQLLHRWLATVTFLKGKYYCLFCMEV